MKIRKQKMNMKNKIRKGHIRQRDKINRKIIVNSKYEVIE